MQQQENQEHSAEIETNPLPPFSAGSRDDASRDDRLTPQHVRMLESILRTTNDHIYVVEHDGRILFSAPIGPEILGVEPTSFLGKTGEELGLPPELAARLREERLQVKATSKPVSGSATYAIYGHEREFEYTWSPMLGDDGNVDAVLFWAKDVTDRNRANAASREREAQLRALFQYSREAIGIASEGRIEFVNPAYAELLGYSSPEELIGLSATATVAPADRDRLTIIADMRSEGCETPTLYEYRGIRKDGSEVDLENHVSTYEIDGKQYTVVTTRDVTERKHAEEALRERQTEVETLNTRLRRSMRETHHRVKNNLQVISAMLDLQEMQHGENIPVSEIVRLRQHIRTLAMIHDLLTYQARDDDEVHDLSIKEAMERLLPMVQGVISGRQVRFDVEEARLPIRQSTTFAVLVNELVSNAVKHGEGTIHVRFYISRDTANLEVLDEGPGFPAGFDPRKSANTGLELIQSLAQWDLAGQSSFRNLETGGACASIQFPLVKADPSGGEW